MTPFPVLGKIDFEDTVPQFPIWEDSNFIDTRAEPAKLKQDRPAALVIKETYPRIHRQIELLWGTQELQNKFTRWLLTDQEKRIGWPPEVTSALFTLSNIHAWRFGLEGSPVWGEKPDRW